MPSVIDRDFYEHLQALKGGEARAKYIANLETRLSTEAVKAAIGRLDEAIAHADKLAAGGKVVATAEWEHHEVQRGIVSPGLAYQAKFELVNGSSMESGGKRIAEQSAWELSMADVFTRDLAMNIAKSGWF